MLADPTSPRSILPKAVPAQRDRCGGPAFAFRIAPEWCRPRSPESFVSYALATVRRADRTAPPDRAYPEPEPRLSDTPVRRLMPINGIRASRPNSFRNRRRNTAHVKWGLPRPAPSATTKEGRRAVRAVPGTTSASWS